MGNGYTRLLRIEGIKSQALPKKLLKRDVDIPEKIQNRIKEGEIWIEVSLAEQVLYVWEGLNKIKAGYRVSTGMPGTPRRKSKATRKGIYKMYCLYKAYTMWGNNWWAYAVPHCMFFHGEFAIHAAYWHNDFGTPVSHGCVNMTEMDAAEVYPLVKIGTTVWVY